MVLSMHAVTINKVFAIYPTKVILNGLKRNISRGNSLSDELELSSVLGDTRVYLYGPVWGSYSEPKVAFGPLFPTATIFSWVGIGLLYETDCKKPNNQIVGKTAYCSNDKRMDRWMD